MTTVRAVLWIAFLIGALAVGVAALVWFRLGGRRRQTVTGATADTPTAVPASNPDGPSDEAVHFDLHIFFAEAKETHLVVDALADLPDDRGRLFGVPVSLVLLRPDSVAAANVLLQLLHDAGQDGCEVEVDVTGEQASMKLRSSGRELSIPVQAASGLPLAS